MSTRHTTTSNVQLSGGMPLQVKTLALLLSVLLASAVAQASIDRGAIRGTVSDAQGAVAPGTTVTVTDTDTGVVQVTRANSAGFYFVPELVPGNYKIHFELAGFAPVDVAKVEVKPNDVATVDIRLELGRSAQHVEVRAQNALIETASANFRMPIEERYIQDLPLVGRDIQNLVYLVPGVVQTYGPPGALVAFNSAFGGFPDPTHHAGSLVAVNGGQAGANLWYLDGSLNAAQGADNVVVSPSPDAVSEFQAVDNGFAAEYGRHAGGVFNVVLKSGSNQVHGDLYEYNRNSYFHARNPFYQLNAQGQPFLNFINWNQFGGTVGGPVYLPHLYHGKNRTFFFASWDISEIHHNTGANVYTIPTLKMRMGDFSEFPNVVQSGLYDPMSAKPDSSSPTGYSRQQFLNSNGTPATSLPASRLDPIAQWWINQYPAPNYLDPRQQNASAGGCLNTCNNFIAASGNSQTIHNLSFKVDHQISEKNKLFVEWLFNPAYVTTYRQPWTGPTAPLGGAYRSPSQIATLGHTYTFGSSLLNEFRLTYIRSAQLPAQLPDSLTNYSKASQYIPKNTLLDPPFIVEPLFIVGGFATALGNNAGLSAREMTDAYMILDNVTKVLGRHTLKTGFIFRDDRQAFESGIGDFMLFGGGLTASELGAGGSGWAQFLLGAVDQGSFYGNPRNAFWSGHSWGFYGQDDFRVNSKLTLNLGLRYDIFEWFKTRHDHMGVFDFNNPNPLIPTRLGRVVYTGTPAHPAHTVFPANTGNWAPRLNFAYTPFGNSKTVVRGGIDLIYADGMTQEVGQGQGSEIGIGYGTQYYSWSQYDATGQGLGFTNQTPAFLLSQGVPFAPPAPDFRTANTQFLGSGIVTLTKHSGDPYLGLWNLQIERELPGNLVVSVGYVGSKGTHLQADLNRAIDYVPTAVRQQYRLKLSSTSVPTPSDLVSIYGPTYPLSYTFARYPQYLGSVVGNLFGDGNSSYNALHLKIEKRFTQGLSFILAYAAQKSITSVNVGAYLDFNNYAPVDFGGGRSYQVGGNGWSTGFGGYNEQNLDNRRADRALGPDDTPQLLNLALDYELPIGPGRRFAGNVVGAPRLLTQGWKISTTFNAQKGLPLQINGPANYLTTRVNLIGDPSAGRSSKTRIQQEAQWFNPSAFEAVYGSDPNLLYALQNGHYPNGSPFDPNTVDALWRFGNAGYRLGNARSPGFWGADMALLKDFRISESKYLQFRFQAFNAFNHQNLAVPNTTWCLPPNTNGTVDPVHQFGCMFGRITNIQTDPRNLQFGLKFVF